MIISRTLTEIIRARQAWYLLTLLVLIQLLVEVNGGYQQCSASYEFWGLSQAGIAQGRYWQWLSYTFLHGSWLHLLTNGLLIMGMGAAIQRMFSGKLLAVIFLVGSTMGGIFHSLLGGKGEDLLVGSSGGAFGLLLFVCTISPESRLLPLFLRAGNVGAGVAISSFLLALMNPALGVPFFSQCSKMLAAVGLADLFLVGHACHLGGCVAGWLCARWLLRRRFTREDILKQREKYETRRN